MGNGLKILYWNNFGDYNRVHPVGRPDSDLRSHRFNTFSRWLGRGHLRRGFFLDIMRINILLYLDILSIVVSWLLVRWNSRADNSSIIPNSPTLISFLIVVLGVIFASDLYKAGPKWHSFWRVVKAVLLGTGIGGLTFFTHSSINTIDGIDPIRILEFGFISSFTAAICRIFLAQARNKMRERGGMQRSAFLICSASDRPFLLRKISKQKRYCIRGESDMNALDVSNRAATLSMLHKMGIDEVFVSWDAICNRLFLCWNFRNQGIIVNILPTSLKPLFWQPETFVIDGIPALKISPLCLGGASFWMKRSFDICSAFILLTILTPVLLLISVLIKLESAGPIFYKQTRLGLNNKEFQMWKFRSMVVNADSLQKSLEDKNESEDGILFKIKEDPRVTRIGSFLRKYSLDELPQLFNVIAGEMSLVGPRPLSMRDANKITNHRSLIRHEVLPGITGLWQVSGRANIVDFEKFVQLDLMYIENWSLLLDIEILLRTIGAVLRKSGAY